MLPVSWENRLFEPPLERAAGSQVGITNTEGHFRDQKLPAFIHLIVSTESIVLPVTLLKTKQKEWMQPLVHNQQMK